MAQAIPQLGSPVWNGVRWPCGCVHSRQAWRAGPALESRSDGAALATARASQSPGASLRADRPPARVLGPVTHGAPSLKLEGP